MTCMALFAQPLAMATTQLERVLHYENAFSRQVEDTLMATEKARKPLRLSWVVVTDTDGNRKLRMQWTVTPSADPR
jgi:hypothetical protein